MLFRIHDEKNEFPACHRGGHGVADVLWQAAHKDEDGHILMMVHCGFSGEKWGAMAAYMSPEEAKDLSRKLLDAANEVEPHYGS